MVQRGVTTKSDMKCHLTLYAEEKFPDASIADAAYYPGDKAISDALYAGRLQLRYDSIDKKNVEIQVNHWKKERPKDFFYYRPFTAQDDIEGIRFEDDEDDVYHQIPYINKKKLKCSLLFIYQSYGQLQIMKR